MSEPYKQLPLYTLARVTSYFQPRQELPERVTMSSPAVQVMTDLRQVTAYTVEANVSIDWALFRMKELGVRLLLVINSRNQVQGLITASDIQGDKPMRLINELGGRHEEIMVREIMTPYDALEVLRMEDVLRAQVGNLVVTLQNAGRRHALVVDRDRFTGEEAVRGIFSLSQIGRQLGRPLDAMELPSTFAQHGIALSS